MKPFFSYFGTKYTLAPFYGKPRFSTIIDPFAGSAAFSCYWEPRRAILADKSEKVAMAWDFILRVTESEMLSLPLLEAGEDLRDHSELSPEARAFIGFNATQASDHPCNIRPRDGWSFWTSEKRAMVASQLYKVKDWKFIYGNYKKVPMLPATYFLDPPYQCITNVYGEESFRNNYGAGAMDYFSLAIWASCLPGDVTVAENVHADWLPFQSFQKRVSSLKVRHESIYADHEVVCQFSNSCCLSCFFRFGQMCWLHSRRITEFEACSSFEPQTEGFPVKCGSCVHYLPPINFDPRSCRQGIKSIEDSPACSEYKAKDGYRLIHWLGEDGSLCDSDPNPLATDGNKHPVTCDACMHRFLDLQLAEKIKVLERHGLDDKIKKLLALGVQASVTPQTAESRHVK